MADVPLIQRGTRRDGYQYSEDDDNESDSSFGKGNTTQPRAVMKNGLLIRRRTGHIESDDWNTGASTSTEMRSRSSDLRLRENGSLEKVSFFFNLCLDRILIFNILSQYNLSDLRLVHPPLQQIGCPRAAVRI